MYFTDALETLKLAGSTLTTGDSWPSDITSLLAPINEQIVITEGFNGYATTGVTTLALLANINLVFRFICANNSSTISLSEDCDPPAMVIGNSIDFEQEQIDHIRCIIDIIDQLINYIDTSTCCC